MRPVVSNSSEQEEVKVSQWSQTARAAAIRQNWEEDQGFVQLFVMLFICVLEHILPSRHPVLHVALLVPRISESAEVLSLNTLMCPESSGSTPPRQSLPLGLCSLCVNLQN